MDNTDVIEIRKEAILKTVKNKSLMEYLPYGLLFIIIYLGYKLRVQNLVHLIDRTTGQYIPIALDPYLFLRYAEEILANGKLAAIDTLRYYPIGYVTGGENILLSYMIVWLYKIIHAFNPEATLQYVDVIYPPIAFAVGLIFFFLLVKKLFNWKIAVLASAFLATVPTYLFRTTAGFADKEALGSLLLFVSLYLYVHSWQAKTLRNTLIFSAMSGVSTGVMALVWGGVNFVWLTLGAFVMIEIFLNKLTKRDFYAYTAFLIPLLLIVFTQTNRYPPQAFFASVSSGILGLAWLTALVHYIIFEKKWLKIHKYFDEKLPEGVSSFIIAAGIAIIGTSIYYGPTFIISRLREVYISFTRPFGETRWSLTVAENHQPYIKEWFDQLGLRFIWAFIIGSILFFYSMIKGIEIAKKKKYYITAAYALFVISFIFSRYSQESEYLNGTGQFALFLYLGVSSMFIILLGYIYLRSYYKDKSVYQEIRSIPKIYVFMFIFFVLMLVAARSAARLLFIFSPVISIFAAYTFDYVFIWSKTLTKQWSKLVIWVVIMLVLFSPITISDKLGEYGDKGIINIKYKEAKAIAAGTGPSYDPQWQIAMDWVRKNTPKDAVFAHWWDYGYWVQYGSRRATLGDGGNSRGAINHFMGRHVLTGHSDREALELLAANNATHLLMIVDEIGKYPAYSSIGADVGYDRYSFIPVFSQNLEATREGREGEVIYTYEGGAGVDHDITYSGTIFPDGAAGIIGFQIPVIVKDGVPTFNQPVMTVVYNNQQFLIPLNCLWYDGDLNLYDGGIDACVRMLTVFNSETESNAIGGLFYLSPEVSQTRFTHLFLFDEENEFFKKVYDDSSMRPLAVFQGRLVGPLKIWELSYPDDLEIPPEYYGETLPDPRVQEVR